MRGEIRREAEGTVGGRLSVEAVRGYWGRSWEESCPSPWGLAGRRR